MVYFSSRTYIVGGYFKYMNLSKLTHGGSTIGDFRLFMPNSSQELTLGGFFGITS